VQSISPRKAPGNLPYPIIQGKEIPSITVQRRSQSTRTGAEFGFSAGCLEMLESRGKRIAMGIQFLIQVFTQGSVALQALRIS
jgi:hypothetical protein